MHLPDGHRTVSGRLLYEKQSDGEIQSYFRYEPSWIARSDAFPLDPLNLPLQTGIFQLKSRTGLWGVMEDALPDAWGRRLIQARRMVDVSRDNNIALLLLTGWAEPGATGFGESNTIPGQHIVPMDMKMTDQAILASELFEKDKKLIDLPDFFVSGGSSAGGARPKVLARSENTHYLVKFPSINDPSAEIIAQLEFFGMTCALYSKIPVPEFFLVESSGSRMALAVKRFDTTKQKGRHHFLSFQSLTGISEQLGLPYARMAKIIQDVSGTPREDLQNLYKQMVLNVLISNCDDHLKNFSMLYSPAIQQFRLSPAYDIVPNLWQREHILSINHKTGDIDHADLLHEGKSFSLSRQHSLQLLAQTLTGVEKALQSNDRQIRLLSAAHPLCHTLFVSIRQKIDTFKLQQNSYKK